MSHIQNEPGDWAESLGVKANRALRCTEIADRVVPEYRKPQTGGRYYSCTGTTAKRWQAAWDGACVALGGDPKEYLK